MRLRTALGSTSSFVGVALLVEQLYAWHGHHANLFAGFRQLLGSLDAEVELGAGADQDQLRVPSQSSST